MASPIVLRSTDSGAARCSGTVGDLTALYAANLVIAKMFTGVSAASYVDNTVEAQGNLVGQTAFNVFQGPTVTVDEAYFGLSSKFDRLTLNFGTVGIQNAAVTLVWEYWNGTAWTALTVTDTTYGLTVNGKVTWAIPASWTTKAVNSITMYWLRLRFTAGSWTTNPLVNYSSITGWVVQYSGTNQLSFQQGGGNLFFLDINDNGPGVGTGKEARAFGWETMSAVGTGTGQHPTAAQLASGIPIRKSATLDTTARTWIMIADDRTVMFFVITGDTAGVYNSHYWGDFYSYIPNDNFRTFHAGKANENNGTAADYLVQQLVSSGSLAFAITGNYVVRAFTGLGGSLNVGKTSSGALTASSVGFLGQVQFPNGADGGLYLSPLQIHEPNTATIRGRLRGLYVPLHAFASFADGDTIAGTGVYAGKTFLFIKQVNAYNGGAPQAGVACIETSDTWDTN